MYLKVLICIHFLYVINILFTLYFVNISSLFEFCNNNISVNLLYYITSISDISASSVFRNGNVTELSPIRSVIIQVLTKSDDRGAGVGFVYHEYDYRPNWTPLSPIIN